MPGKGLEFACENPKQKEREETPEQVLRALSSLESTEEKLAALCKKYTDLLEEHRQLQTRFKQSQKSLTTIVKEKEHLQSEHSKAVLAKSKLESLCRELQRHNKLIKEESLGRAKEEEEKRKEVTNKFQTTINDIQSQMNEHYSKNTKLREENVELANKLKSLIEQYETREEHIEKIVNHKDLEKQLVEAKLAQATLLLTEEKETHLKERETLLTEATEAHKKIASMEQAEKMLREQVALYTEKYEDFQSTLTKSNDVFQSFKTEMDKMTKKIKKLEKETVMWRGRWESSNKTLLDMAEEKTRAAQHAAVQESKIKKLESLCRVMQEERRRAAAAAREEAPAEAPQQPDTTSDDVPLDPVPDSSAANGTVAESTTPNVTESTAEPQEVIDADTRPRAKNGTPEKSVRPTTTPPNTPDEGNLSRASPVTVQAEVVTETPGEASPESQDKAEESPVVVTEQEATESAPVEGSTPEAQSDVQQPEVISNTAEQVQELSTAESTQEANPAAESVQVDTEDQVQADTSEGKSEIAESMQESKVEDNGDSVNNPST